MKLKPFQIVALLAVVIVTIVVWIHRTGANRNKPQTESSNSSSVNTQAANNNRHFVAPPVYPLQPVDPATLSSSVQPIVNENAPYLQRLSAAEQVHAAKITAVDQDGLLSFLLQQHSLDGTQQGQVLKNELMTALCEMDPPPAALRDVLTQIYRDGSRNEVVRDYAIQHLIALYGQLESAAGMEPQARSYDLSQIQDVLWQAVNEIDDSIGGTALLGLSRLSEGRTDFNRDQIALKALQMIRGNGASELARITAVQVCAQMELKDSLPSVMQIAQNGETMTLRISAVGALSTLGGSDQTAFLDGLLNGPEDRLKAPAQQALNQIRRRERQQSQIATKPS